MILITAATHGIGACGQCEGNHPLEERLKYLLCLIHRHKSVRDDSISGRKTGLRRCRWRTRLVNTALSHRWPKAAAADYPMIYRQRSQEPGNYFVGCETRWDFRVVQTRTGRRCLVSMYTFGCLSTSRFRDVQDEDGWVQDM